MSGVYAMPVELAVALATPTGLAEVIKARVAGVTFRRLAAVSERGGRYVATLDFKTPMGPERKNGLVIALAVAPGVMRLDLSVRTEGSEG